LLKVGLTGGIASGKSTVGEMMVALGAHLIQADTIAHDLMRPGETVYEEVVRHFGSEILNPNKTINRGRLAGLAFGTPAKLGSRIEELNKIVHPAVIARQNEWMEKIGRENPYTIAIVEAALIIEAHVRPDFDRLVVVTCRLEQRIERWATKMKVSNEVARADVERRMAAQLPDQEKIKAANYVIDNSGTLGETQSQVNNVYRKLRAEADKIAR
jgi:dephospho-CoA kinase